MKHIAIVGIDNDSEMVTHMAEYMGRLPEMTVIYTLDEGEFHKQVASIARTLSFKCVIMQKDTAVYGVAAKSKRNVNLAKEVSKVVAFWDLRDSDIGSVIATAKIWGKGIHVNPHEDGGIKSDPGLVLLEKIGDGKYVPIRNDNVPDGRRGGLGCGICGFDDDETEEAGGTK